MWTEGVDTREYINDYFRLFIYIQKETLDNSLLSS